MSAGLEQLFSRVAPYYDFLNRVLSLNQDRSWRRRIVAEMRLEEGGRVLDMCTGTGEIALALARKNPSGMVCALDFSREMLGRALRKIVAGRLQERIRLVQADALAPPFPPRTFDAVAVGFGLRNLSDPCQGIGQIAALLKPGGRAAILEFSPPRAHLLGKAARFYLMRVLPKIASVCGGDSAAYRHLSSSISTFLSPAQIVSCMAANGFENIRIRPMCGEVVYAYFGEVSHIKTETGPVG